MVRSRDSPKFTHNPQDVRLRSPRAVILLNLLTIRRMYACARRPLFVLSSSSGRLFFAFQAKNGHNTIIFHLIRSFLYNSNIGNSKKGG